MSVSLSRDYLEQVKLIMKDAPNFIVYGHKGESATLVFDLDNGGFRTEWFSQIVELFNITTPKITSLRVYVEKDDCVRLSIDSLAVNKEGKEKEFTITGGGDEELNKKMRDAVKGAVAMRPKMPKPSKPIKESGGLVSNEPDLNIRGFELNYGEACKHCYTKTESIFHFITKNKCSHCGRSL